jgi:hypothetical protein
VGQKCLAHAAGTIAIALRATSLFSVEADLGNESADDATIDDRFGRL